MNEQKNCAILEYQPKKILLSHEEKKMSLKNKKGNNMRTVQNICKKIFTLKKTLLRFVLWNT